MENGIPEEKKALVVDLIMELRAVLHEPDQARAREAAVKLIDRVDREMAEAD